MNWKTLKSEQIFKSGLVTIDKDTCELPDGRIMPGYYTLRFPDWVNIVPITAQGEVILIKQYRHATGKVHLEAPGGAVNRGENPDVGALRELREETGFISDKIIKLAENYPNPALQDNRIHTYLALNCEDTGEQELDPFEDIEVVKLPLSQLEDKVRSGDIDHTIVVASIFHALAYLRKNSEHAELLKK